MNSNSQSQPNQINKSTNQNMPIFFPSDLFISPNSNNKKFMQSTNNPTISHINKSNPNPNPKIFNLKKMRF